MKVGQENGTSNLGMTSRYLPPPSFMGALIQEPLQHCEVNPVSPTVSASLARSVTTGSSSCSWIPPDFRQGRGQIRENTRGIHGHVCCCCQRGRCNSLGQGIRHNFMETLPVLDFKVKLFKTQDPAGQAGRDLRTVEGPSQGNIVCVDSNLCPLKVVPPLVSSPLLFGGEVIALCTT